MEVYPSDKPHAYWYLGRVGHLLQDMASPAHVHLDAHLPESTDVSGDSYERWTQFEDNYKRITYQSANTEIPDVLLLPDPPFSTPACWDRNLTRLFWNLAMFTRGFDSDDSNDSLVHHGRFNSYYASAQVSPSDIGLLGSLYTHFAL